MHRNTPGSYSNAEVSPSFFSIDGATGEAAGTVDGREAEQWLESNGTQLRRVVSEV